MKKFLCALLLGASAVLTLSNPASAAPPSSTPTPVKASADHRAAAAPANIKPAAMPGPINRQHPPIVLVVTENQLQLVLTPFGWVYVNVPVQYYVTAVWNPTFQAYGYYDRAGFYHLYQPPVVVPFPVLRPRLR